MTVNTTEDVNSPDTRNLCTNNKANIIFSMLSKKAKFYLWRNLRIFIIKFEKKREKLVPDAAIRIGSTK